MAAGDGPTCGPEAWLDSPVRRAPIFIGWSRHSLADRCSAGTCLSTRDEGARLPPSEAELRLGANAHGLSRGQTA